MLEYIKEESNITYTENGAVSLESTGSECLDLFASIGALRNAPEKDILSRFIQAYTENPDLAMKILFFARDIRGGLGERRVFRTIVNWLAKNEPKSLKKNIEYIAEYGRYDDLLALLGTPLEADALDIIKFQFNEDLKAAEKDEAVSLLAKWLPSVNTSNAASVCRGKRVAKALNLSEKEYRKALSSLRAKIRIIENNLRLKDYSFDYSKQPSRAMFKYKKAFDRNDKERYRAYIKAVSEGTAKMHADNVSPYELVDSYLAKDWYLDSQGFMKDISPEEAEILNATWNSLPSFGGNDNALAVIDTSGSMYWSVTPSPASVALSLGLYFAEHSKGAFSNHFIEFSEKPKLIEIKGDTFAEKLRYICSFNEVANTNLEAVFNLILKAAVKNHVPQEELPSKLIIISDMEFDSCVEDADLTNLELAKKKFESYGYKLPQVVFWNVASRHKNQPVSMNEEGVALVSGVTPRLFSMVAGGIVSPYAAMMDVIGSERYSKISA